MTANRAERMNTNSSSRKRAGVAHIDIKENDTNTKDVLANIVEYSNQINKLMNAQAKIVGGEDADGSMSIEGKKASGGTFMTSM